MEPPKDYVEYSRLHFSKRDVDDAKIEGFMVGIIGAIGLISILVLTVKFAPIF